ncbi:MAG: hypothetical protein R3F39_18980 [Myxococcota bacterium]
MGSRLRGLLLGITLLAAATAAVIVYLELQSTAPRGLARQGGATATPLVDTGPAALSDTELAKVRAKRLRALAASAALPDTLGFSLGQTHRVEVDGWLTRFGDKCAASEDGRTVRCSRIDGLRAGWSPIESLVLSFNPSDRLVAVDIEREPLDAVAATELFFKRDTTMARSLGPPTYSHGELDARWVQAEPLRQVRREYASRGFSAHLALTGFGPHRARVRESYRWVPSPPVPLTP